MQQPGTRVTRPFAEARADAHALALPSAAAWRAWAYTPARPADIPLRPDAAYRQQGWGGWRDWLGPARVWRPFPEARAAVQALHLPTHAAWCAWSRSGARPHDLPSNPQSVYRATGWGGWGDWLGTGRVATAARSFRPFAAARAAAQRLHLRDQRAWTAWAATPARPCDMPACPHQVYRATGWAGWRDWLGPQPPVRRPQRFRPYRAARAYARRLGLPHARAWYRWAATSARPPDIPANPARTYRGAGWTGFAEWLGGGERRAAGERGATATEAMQRPSGVRSP